MMTDDTMTPTTEAEDASKPAESAGVAPETTLTADQPSSTNSTTAAPEGGEVEHNPADEAPAQTEASAPAGELEPSPVAVAQAPAPAPAPTAPSAPDRSEDEMLFEAAMSALESGEDVTTEGGYK